MIKSMIYFISLVAEGINLELDFEGRVIRIEIFNAPKILKILK